MEEMEHSRGRTHATRKKQETDRQPGFHRAADRPLLLGCTTVEVARLQSGEPLRGRRRSGGRQANAFGVLQIRLDGRHDDARLNRNKLDANQRDPGKGVDDDSLVENAVHNLSQSAGITSLLYFSHRL